MPDGAGVRLRISDESRGREASEGCQSPDDWRLTTKNQGTYVPRSLNEFLKSTPLGSLAFLTAGRVILKPPSELVEYQLSG